jgi:serine/threonine protein kinase
LEKKKKVPLNKLYPAAKPAALDLMDKMLTFSPDRRISVEEALRHPYFASLHNAKKEPECKAHFDFTFERIEMTKEALQGMTYLAIHTFSILFRFPFPDPIMLFI